MKSWKHQFSVGVNLFAVIAKILAVWLLAAVSGKKTVIVARAVHLGDNVAVEPISRQLKRREARTTLVWLTENMYMPVVQLFPDVDHVFAVRCSSVIAILQRLIPLELVVPDVHGRFCWSCHFRVYTKSQNRDISFLNYAENGSLLEIFQKCALLDVDPLPPRLRPLGERTPGQYVVVAAGSREVDRQWPKEKWRLFFQHLCDSGVAVWEVGYAPVVPEFSHKNYVSKCGVIATDRLAAIIRGAKVFVGCDSGPAHIANAYRVPGLLLFGMYRGVENYLPYTGFYAERQEDFVVRHPGSVADLPLDVVKERWDMLYGTGVPSSVAQSQPVVRSICPSAVDLH